MHKRRVWRDKSVQYKEEMTPPHCKCFTGSQNDLVDFECISMKKKMNEIKTLSNALFGRMFLFNNENTQELLPFFYKKLTRGVGK